MKGEREIQAESHRRFFYELPEWISSMTDEQFNHMVSTADKSTMKIKVMDNCLGGGIWMDFWALYEIRAKYIKKEQPNPQDAS